MLIEKRILVRIEVFFLLSSSSKSSIGQIGYSDIYYLSGDFIKLFSVRKKFDLENEGLRKFLKIFNGV